MSTARTIKQLILETRSISAEIVDEGGDTKIKLPVFAWALYDDNSIEPLFIHSSF